MKIKGVLLTLLTEGDVSDHHDPQSASWYHGSSDCAFCEAARAAEIIIDSVALRDVFDPGHEVVIGDVTGVVENVDIVYEVRITDANGNRRYGRFASEYVSAPPAASPADEYFSDRDGDIWKVVGEKTLRLLECGGEIIPEKATNNCAQAEVEQLYGPLVPVKR